MDLFRDYNLQRDELLARIAQELELDKTRRDKLEQAYGYLEKVLKRDENFFADVELALYSQGSIRIGTSVKPHGKDDFDLDTVLELDAAYQEYFPNSVFNALVRVIKNDGNYKDIFEIKSRCVRLNFKSDFHIDILPSCKVSQYPPGRIAIPEKELNAWSFSNPKGFAEWFLERSKSSKSSLLETYFQKAISPLGEQLIKADVEAEPLPEEEMYMKTPLQRSVQLIKRARDIYFEKRGNRVSSIVLTTLIGQHYDGESSIYDTLVSTTAKIKGGFLRSIEQKVRFQVFNPVDKEEEFTDSWSEKHYEAFYAFVEDFHSRLSSIKDGFGSSGEDYIKLFGEGRYKKALKDQLSQMSRFSSDGRAINSGLIMNSQAYTDRDGNTNRNTGVKNEQHHNFGGVPTNATDRKLVCSFRSSE